VVDNSTAEFDFLTQTDT